MVPVHLSADAARRATVLAAAHGEARFTSLGAPTLRIDFAHWLTRLMSPVVSQGRVRPEPNLMFPHFAKAGTM